MTLQTHAPNLRTGSRLLLLALIVYSTYLPAQSSFYRILFQHITVEDGLSQNSVIDIEQDSSGFLWLATQDGLNRFDGYEFVHYEKYFDDITMPDNHKLGRLFIDHLDHLWIIPNTNIPETYNPIDDTFAPHPQLRKVSCMTQDKDQHFWFGTYDGYLINYDFLNQDSTRIKVGPPGNIIYELITDVNNNIWLATSNGIYCRLAVNRNLVNIVVNSPQRIAFNTIAVDHKGHIWAGSFGKGVFVKKTNSSQFDPLVNFLKNKTIPANLTTLSLLQETDELMWIGTYGKGLFKVDLKKGTYSNFIHKKGQINSIAYNDILSIKKDQQGVIWFGTDGGGVSFYNKLLSYFHVFTNEEMPAAINIDVVRSLLVDRNQHFWVGTSGNGLARFDPQRGIWKTYTDQNTSEIKLSGRRIMALTEDQDGDIWIGTQGKGLDILSAADGQIKPASIHSSTPDSEKVTVWSLALESSDSCWVGTRKNGLFLYHKKLGVLKQYLPNANIRTIILGPENELWIGTDNDGLYRFNKKQETFTHYKKNNLPEDSPASDKIKCLYFDKEKNRLWIGTNGAGISVFAVEEAKFYHYNLEDGLPNNVIYGILPGDNHSLWLSSNNGLIEFIPPDDLSLLQNATLYHYTSQEGLQGQEFNTGAYHKAKDGTLFFGGINGFNFFKPNQIKKPIQKLKPMLTRFEVANVPFQLDSLVYLKQEIQLKHSQNDLSFVFAADNISLPRRNKFKYRLVNYNDQWVESGTRNYAHFTNLSPGNYVFELKANVDNRDWSDGVRSINITIRYPWWNTILMKIIYLLLVGAVIYQLYVFQKRRWELKAQLFSQKEEAIRLREIDLLKSNIYTSITHEFRTPLTIITGLMKKVKGNHKVKNIVLHNADRLLSLVNQMLDLSKIDSGNMKVNYQQANIISFLQYLTNSMQPLAYEHKINLVFHSDIAFLLVDFDKKHLEKIIINLLSNALKFTDEFGAVKVITKKTENQQLIIEVHDNGKGIPPDKMDAVFDRFYQVDNASQTHVGTGLGLALVQELVFLLNGQIAVDSTMAKGTVFSVTLPITNKATVISEEITKQFTYAPLTNEDEETINQPKKDPSNLPVILLVEDNKDVIFYLKTILGNDYQIEEAYDGKAGLVLAQKSIPDLIISDIMMPEKDGFELCRILKSETTTQHIPLILLTAKTSMTEKLKGLRSGADVYLTKPFNEEELLIKVEQLLHRNNNHPPHSTPQNSAVSSSVEKQNPFLRKVNELLEEHIDDTNFGISELCDDLNISRMQLHRKLSALTDQSASRYIRSFKVNVAKEYLISTNLTITEIAYKVGFDNVTYFSKIFSEEMGLSPRQYRLTHINS